VSEKPPSRPSLQISPLLPGGERFAAEPPDFGQVHKVFTKHLEWCENDARDLRRFVWRGPLAFGLASAGLGLFGNALVTVANASKSSPVTTSEWIVFGAGGIAGLVFFVIGGLALNDTYSMVDKLADRIKELRY
jgi:hypothetical protein